MKFTKVITLLLVLCPLAGISQKIKYEDLVKLISEGSFDQAEPQLKAFMADPKNAEHANSYVQMGIVIEKRFYATDVLSDSSLIAARADSANAMFKKAISLLDEKELKKNSNLYQAFYRRDLRTGEFGIKLSDVHLDLEKKTENIQKRRADIDMMRRLIARVNTRNRTNATLYQQFVTLSPDYKILLFKMNEADVASLDKIRDNSQGLVALINDLKAAAKELGAVYFQSFESLQPIVKYGVDGINQSNMLAGELAVWDYDAWATATRSDYAAIKQYQTDIMNKEAEVNTALGLVAEGLSSDPISLDEINKSAATMDPGGAAVSLLQLKMARLAIGKLTHPAINPEVADSANIYSSYVLAGKVGEKLSVMGGQFAAVVDSDAISVAVQRYPEVIGQHYGGTTGLSNYLTEYGNWLAVTTNKWQMLADRLAERQKYAITAADSIPLFNNVDKIGKYLTMQVLGDADVVAGGIDIKANEGFIAWSGSDRTIAAKKSFKMSTLNPAASSGIVPSAQFAFYIFNRDAPKDNLTIVSTGGVGTLKWVNTITAPNEPMSFRYDEALDQVTVFFVPQDQLPTDGSVAYIVIDRAGKVR